MKLRLVLALASSCCFVCKAFCEVIHFDDEKSGIPPLGWTATNTGPGKAEWTVLADPSAPSAPNVLKQSGVATYPVCLKQGVSLHDGFVSVKFKPMAGKEDQAGGVVWRATDASNYYIARANALEDNVTIYHTLGGKRVAFKNVNRKVAPNVWHTLQVRFAGDQFTVVFDGVEVLSASDSSIKDAGMVGVWTKADSVTLFDDFSFGPLTK